LARRYRGLGGSSTSHTGRRGRNDRLGGRDVPARSRLARVQLFHEARYDPANDLYAGRDPGDLMEAPAANLTVRSGYNLAAMSFSPADLEREIQKHRPKFSVRYELDSRQAVADSWLQSIDDGVAANDWGWKPKFGLAEMVEDMLFQLVHQRKAPPAWALHT